MNYQVKLEILKGPMQFYHKLSFKTSDEAISCVESVAEGDYELKVLEYFPLCVLTFKNCKAWFNFDPEEESPEPQYDMFDEGQVQLIRPEPSKPQPVKSRMVSLHDLACEALGVHVYLELKRLRSELRKLGTWHQRKTKWEYDRVLQKEKCEYIKEVVLKLRDAPRRNRKRKVIPKAKGNRARRVRR